MESSPTSRPKRHILSHERAPLEPPMFVGPDISDRITDVVVIKDYERGFKALVRVSDGHVLDFKPLRRHRA